MGNFMKLIKLLKLTLVFLLFIKLDFVIAGDVFTTKEISKYCRTFLALNYAKENNLDKNVHINDSMKQESLICTIYFEGWSQGVDSDRLYLSMYYNQAIKDEDTRTKLMNGSKSFCLDGAKKIEEIIDVFVQYTSNVNNKHLLDKPAGIGIMSAINDKWPCK